MINRIFAIYKRYEEIHLYILFGFLTTLVNYLVYLPLHGTDAISAAMANILAWCASVIFAFLTNKRFVFKSKDWTLKTLIPEVFGFVAARIASLVVETAIIFVTVDLLAYSGVYMKIITSVIVVILNYIASKLVVFNKKRGG